MADGLQELSSTDATDDVIAAMEADGGVIVHDLVDPAVLATLRRDLGEAAEGRPFGSQSGIPELEWFWGEKTMRFTRLATRSPAFLDVLTDPTLLAVADHLLLPHAASYWMNTGQMMILAPDQPEQWLHRDADNWRSINRPDGPEVTVSAMIAVEAFTEANGATRVIPGSHRWDDFDRIPDDGDRVVQAVMPAGSALLYTGRVLHGGGANTTDAWRWGLHVSYVLGWLTPEEALPLGTPWEAVKDLPERVQQLLGWRCTTATPGGGRLWTVDYEDVPVGLELDSGA